MVHPMQAAEKRRFSAQSTVSVLALAVSAATVACSGDVYYPKGNPGDGATAGTTNVGSGGGGATAGSPVASGGMDTAGVGGTQTAPSPMPGGSGGGGGALDCDVVKLQSRTILEKNCASCHGPGTNVGSFDAVLDTPRLLSTGKVVAGNPDTSPLYRRMATGTMPPAASSQKPNRDETAVIYNWIKSCLVEQTGTGVPKCGDPAIDTRTMLNAMLADISKFDLDDRLFIRYLTLTHVRNAGVCDDELDVYRFAMKKAVNALSVGTQLVDPEPVDPYNTIYRIDIRDVEWNEEGLREDKWEAVVDQNPYAIEYEEDEAEVLKQFAGTAVPFMYADFFVERATKPPLYHIMAEIPESLPQLERTLGINIAANIANGDVWRSGFVDSGVSAQNRIIERHEIPTARDRAFYISYDFAQNGGRDNIFTNPLDFEADGGEVIFSLPNGLHAYMVVDAAGTRVDEVPDDIATDPEQEDRNVVNGISCMSCHDVGIKQQEDEIRNFVTASSDFNVNQKQDVAELYPPYAELEALLVRDTAIFTQSVSALNPPPGMTKEPILSTFQRFDENVNLKIAASELGVAPETLLRELGGLDPSLAALGYADVKRETWEAAFAETVCIMNIGIADDPECGQR